MNLSPAFISLVDEYNRPLLVYIPSKDSDDVNKVLKFNVFSNTSLDYFESQLFQWNSLETKPEIKSFFELEGVAVFGTLIRPTGLKIVIGFERGKEGKELTDDAISDVFNKVKKIYLRVKLNPFVAAQNSDDQEELIMKLKEKLSQEFS